jgi:hypothetical protein
LNELCSGFILGIANSVWRERQGSQRVLEPTAEALFLVFSFPVEVRHKVIESPPHRLASRAAARGAQK